MKSIADPLGSEPLSVVRAGDEGFDGLYEAQWWPMGRLAQALVDDVASAEDVVQDAFAGLLRSWPRLRRPGAALGYLRSSVVNGALSRIMAADLAGSGVTVNIPAAWRRDRDRDGAR